MNVGPGLAAAARQMLDAGTPRRAVCAQLRIDLKSLEALVHEEPQQVQEQVVGADSDRSARSPKRSRGESSRTRTPRPTTILPLPARLSADELARIEAKLDGLTIQRSDLLSIQGRVAARIVDACPCCASQLSGATRQNLLDTVEAQLATIDVDVEYYRQRHEQLAAMQ